MNYEMIEAFNKYIIREKTTNQVIKTFSKKIEAKALLRHLNLGGGFDGWSPSFILKKVENS